MTTTEKSLGRAIALTALAPIAERLAKQHEQAERDEARRQGLEDELSALPPLERPKLPRALRPPVGGTPWWRTNSKERGERLLGYLVVGVIVAVVVAEAFAIVFGSSAFVIGLLCGLAVDLAIVVADVLGEIRDGKRVAEAQADYAAAVKEVDEREKERTAIKAKIEEISR